MCLGRELAKQERVLVLDTCHGSSQRLDGDEHSYSSTHTLAVLGLRRGGAVLLTCPLVRGVVDTRLLDDGVQQLVVVSRRTAGERGKQANQVEMHFRQNANIVPL